MATRRKKSNRRYRRGRIYFCAKCGQYSFIDGNNIIQRSMWNPEDWSYIKATGRTCDICRRLP